MNPDGVPLDPMPPLETLVAAAEEGIETAIYRSGEPVAILLGWSQWQAIRSAARDLGVIVGLDENG